MKIACEHAVGFGRKNGFVHEARKAIFPGFSGKRRAQKTIFHMQMGGKTR